MNTRQNMQRPANHSLIQTKSGVVMTTVGDESTTVRPMNLARLAPDFPLQSWHHNVCLRHYKKKLSIRWTFDCLSRHFFHYKYYGTRPHRLRVNSSSNTWRAWRWVAFLLCDGYILATAAHKHLASMGLCSMVKNVGMSKMSYRLMKRNIKLLFMLLS